MKFIKDKEVWVQFQTQLVPVAAVFHNDKIQQIYSFCCAHKHNEKNLLCSTSSLINFQSVSLPWTTSTPHPCQSSWKLLSSKKIIACISVSCCYCHPPEMHHLPLCCFNIHCLVSLNLYQVLKNVNWCYSFLHGGIQFYTFALYTLPCQQPFCQTSSLLPSVTQRWNVMGYCR